MNISKYFLLLLISIEGSADQLFVNFLWSNYFLQFQEKSWFAYAVEILRHSFSHTFALDYRNHIMFTKIYVYQFLNSSKNMIRSTCESNSNAFKQINTDIPRSRGQMSVRPPLGVLAMDTWKQPYSKYRMNCDWLFHSNDDLSYTWLFQLDSYLRLNISFSKFFIKDVFTHCGLAKLLLHNVFPNGVEDLVLCGTRPEFIHYSSSTSIFLEIHYKDTDPVEISFSFSIFDKNIVSSVSKESIMEAKYPINIDSVYTHLVYVMNGTLSTFRIHTEKRKRICIKAKLSTSISYVFIDSPIVMLSSSLHFKLNYSVICTSTFQLLLQIFSVEHKDYIGSDYTSSLNYVSSSYSYLNYKSFNAYL